MCRPSDLCVCRVADCVVKYGMGGWADTSRPDEKGGPLRTNVIFLNASRDFKPTNCFIVAIELTLNGVQIMVQGHKKRLCFSCLSQCRSGISTTDYNVA